MDRSLYVFSALPLHVAQFVLEKPHAVLLARTRISRIEMIKLTLRLRKCSTTRF